MHTLYFSGVRSYSMWAANAMAEKATSGMADQHEKQASAGEKKKAPSLTRKERFLGIN